MLKFYFGACYHRSISNMITQPAKSPPASATKPAPVAVWRRVLAVVIVATFTMGGGLVVLVGTSTATAQETSQPIPLNPENCNGIWIPTGLDAFPDLKAQCEILVEVRNELVANTGIALIGSGHKILNWGGSTPFLEWRNGITITGNAVTTVDISDPAKARLAGEIPTALCRLGRLERLFAASNQLSGSIPECLADLSALRTLDLPWNQLTGELPARLAELEHFQVLRIQENDISGDFPAVSGGAPDWRDLRWFRANDNSFSGPLPANITSENLLVFNVENNDFNGKIPDNYSERFTRISRFNFGNNNLDGLFPSVWWNQITFVQVWIDLEFIASGNKLCFGSTTYEQTRPVEIPNRDEVNDATRYSYGALVSRPSNNQVTIHFEDNVCQNSDYSSYNNSIAFAPVNSMEIGTAEDLNGEVRLVLDWKPEPEWDPGIVNFGNLNLYYDFASVRIWDIRAPSFRTNGAQVKDNNPNDGFDGYQGNFMIRGAILRGMPRFYINISIASVLTDPSKFLEIKDSLAYSVEPVQAVTNSQLTGSFIIYGTGNAGSGVGSGNSFGNEDWRAFNVLMDDSPAQEMARNIGLGPDDSMYSWDAEAQMWSTHPTAGEPNGDLDEGTAVMFQGGVSRIESLRAAGMGLADNFMVLTLHQGWNLLAPAGTGDVVEPDREYVFFDTALTDCENLVGILAIITQDSQFGEFKISLPCHPDLIPRGYEPLDAIDERDSMWVFFQSQLPVPITWDTGSATYGPA